MDEAVHAWLGLHNQLVPFVDYLPGLALPVMHYFHLNLFGLVVHLVGVEFSEGEGFSGGVGVEGDLLIDSEEIPVSFGRDHCDVSDLVLIQGDEPRLVFLKIKVDVDSHFILDILCLRNRQSEFLLIPPFTNPAYVLEHLTFQRIRLPNRLHFESLNPVLFNRIEQSHFFALEDDKAFRVYPAIVSSVMQAINVLVGLKTFSNGFSFLLSKIIKG